MHKYVWLFTLRHLYNIICSYQIRQFCFWKAQQFQWWWNSMYYQIKLFSSCQPKRVYSSKWIAVSWQVSYNSLSWCKNWLGPKVNITRAPQVFLLFLSQKKVFLFVFAYWCDSPWCALSISIFVLFNWRTVIAYFLYHNNKSPFLNILFHTFWRQNMMDLICKQWWTLITIMAWT